MAKRILIVEDDTLLAQVLSENLRIDGFAVAWAADSDEAVAVTQSFKPDLVLLDLMLPRVSGFDVATVLRRGGDTPIIILSARSQKADKLRGLRMGADDYITKPFDLDELVARIHMVLQRRSPPVAAISLGPVTVDFRAWRAWDANGEIHLTHREFDILRLLAARGDRVVYRDELLREVWGFLDAVSTRSVDQAMARLRKKIEPDTHVPRYLRTVRGDGYLLTAERHAVSPDMPDTRRRRR
jgi:DNA-binding response OmpR family regulator